MDVEQHVLGTRFEANDDQYQRVVQRVTRSFAAVEGASVEAAQTVQRQTGLIGTALRGLVTVAATTLKAGLVGAVVWATTAIVRNWDLLRFNLTLLRGDFKNQLKFVGGMLQQTLVNDFNAVRGKAGEIGRGFGGIFGGIKTWIDKLPGGFAAFKTAMVDSFKGAGAAANVFLNILKAIPKALPWAMLGMYGFAALAPGLLTYGAGAAVKQNIITPGIELGSELEILKKKISLAAGGTREELEELTSTAKTAAMSFGHDVVDAFRGAYKIAAATGSTRDAINMLLPALDLARAGMMDVESASMLLNQTLASFQMKSDQARHVVDVLAKSAATSQFEMGEFAGALASAGSAASDYGQSLEDVIATMQIFKQFTPNWAMYTGNQFRMLADIIYGNVRKLEGVLGKGSVFDPEKGTFRRLPEVMDRIIQKLRLGPGELTKIKAGQPFNPYEWRKHMLTSMMGESEFVQSAFMKLLRQGPESMYSSSSILGSATGEGRRWSEELTKVYQVAVQRIQQTSSILKATMTELVLPARTIFMSFFANAIQAVEGFIDKVPGVKVAMAGILSFIDIFTTGVQHLIKLLPVLGALLMWAFGGDILTAVFRGLYNWAAATKVVSAGTLGLINSLANFRWIMVTKLISGLALLGAAFGLFYLAYKFNFLGMQTLLDRFTAKLAEGRKKWATIWESARALITTGITDKERAKLEKQGLWTIIVSLGKAMAWLEQKVVPAFLEGMKAVKAMFGAMAEGMLAGIPKGIDALVTGFNALYMVLKFIGNALQTVVNLLGRLFQLIPGLKNIGDAMASAGAWQIVTWLSALAGALAAIIVPIAAFSLGIRALGRSLALLGTEALWGGRFIKDLFGIAGKGAAGSALAAGGAGAAGAGAAGLFGKLFKGKAAGAAAGGSIPMESFMYMGGGGGGAGAGVATAAKAARGAKWLKPLMMGLRGAKGSLLIGAGISLADMLLSGGMGSRSWGKAAGAFGTEMAGMGAGAGIGALIGSAFFGAGAIPGAVIGGIIGQLIGGGIAEAAFPRMQVGGRIHAAKGVPVPIIAHGQETIVPADAYLSPRGGAKGGQGPLVIEGGIHVNLVLPDVRELDRATIQKAARELADAVIPELERRVALYAG